MRTAVFALLPYSTHELPGMMSLKWMLLQQNRIYFYNLFLLWHDVKILFHMRMAHQSEEENELYVFQHSGISELGCTENHLAILKNLSYSIF